MAVANRVVASIISHHSSHPPVEGEDDRDRNVRFQGYKRLSDPPVVVEKHVLFGDKKDTELSNAGQTKPIGVTGTIIGTMRLATTAVPGNYVHGEVYIASKLLKNGVLGKLHLIHHEDVDGEKIGEFLSESTGMDDFTLPNTWNRYDWCGHRNWGDCDCEKDPCDCRFGIHFVSVSDEENPKELGRFSMPEDVLLGDWNYGARITDTNGDAYAYVYGDLLVCEALELDEDDIGDPTDFIVPMKQFQAQVQDIPFSPSQ